MGFLYCCKLQPASLAELFRKIERIVNFFTRKRQTGQFDI